MANTKIVEELVEAFIENDTAKVAMFLDKEIDLAKSKGNHIVARRLRNLLVKVGSNQNFTAQGLSEAMTLVDDTEQLVERVNSNYALDDVILDNTTGSIIKDLLVEWADYEKLSQHNIYPTNRILFYGAPGTGKTRLAHALASELRLPLIIVRLDELISALLGKTGKNIRDIFDLAKREKIVLLLDEIDTIAKHRDDVRELGELKRVVTVLLQNIDSFPTNSILIGATNHEGLLDQAIWRRFSMKLRFALPDKNQREKLFKLYLSDYPHKINFEVLAELSLGFSGSLIFDVCLDIKKKAVLGNTKALGDVDAIKGLLLFSNPNISNVKVEKKHLYYMCKVLKENDYSLVEISNISNIPYTTLRDNLT